MNVGTNEPQGSQLSAMFDGELPAAECELLARRLGKDAQLRAQWSRYALIGAAMRGEPTLSIGDGRSQTRTLAVADRVAQALGGVSAHGAAAGQPTGQQPLRAWLRRWAQPVAGASVAAGVAALSVFWLQGRVADNNAVLEAQARSANSGEVVLGEVEMPQTRSDAALLAAAQLAAPRAAQRSQPVSNGEPASYTVPAPTRQSGPAVAASQFANYVVAHSEYAAPLNRRSVLSALIASDAANGAAVTAERPADEPVATPDVLPAQPATGR